MDLVATCRRREHPRRFLFVIVLAVSVAAAGMTAARAVPVPPGTAQHQPISRPRHDALSVPAGHRSHLRLSLRSTATTQTSGEWSGYEASGAGDGAYTSVASQWTEPSVTCTTPGIVLFWVGLDGWGDSTVEQTGTGVDCTSGSPQYFAWWETYPANSVQEYPLPVSPGDSISASVTAVNGEYAMDLSDSTQGWTEDILVAAPAGAENASAEVIAEAATSGGEVTPLPYFDAVSFSDSSLNGANSLPVNMVNSNGAIVATTGPNSASGEGNFSVYSGDNIPQTPELAYQGDNGDLWTAPWTGGGTNLGLAMAAGTSPSIAALAGGGYEVAFHSTDGDLWVTSSAGGGATNLGLAMMAGTSPSITGLASGGYEVAVQTTAGYVGMVGAAGPLTISVPMAAGTSPAIGASPLEGSYDVAWQASTGDLWTYTPINGGDNTNFGMMAGTSPSIVGQAGGGWEVAFQANTGNLWTTLSTGGNTGINRNLGMLAGTSPSIGGSPSGYYDVAFQANTGVLWTDTAFGDRFDLNLGMDSDTTSPAITALPGSAYEVAFRANTGTLWITPATGGGTNLGLGVMEGTSPAFAAG